MSRGGHMIKLQREDFSIEEVVNEIKKRSRNIGAVVTFLGVAREFSRGEKVVELEYEAYSEMAVKKLEEIREDALKKFDIIDVIIIHRYGKIDINENIVLIAVAASHRKDAFEACMFCIDELKKRVPIWKKEKTEKGEIWIEEHP